MIQGHGQTINPKAILVADGPFGKDLESNYAITGNQAKELTNLACEAGLDFNQFYRSLLCKEQLKVSPRAAEDSKKYCYANAELAQKYAPILLDEVQELKPYLIIPLGELSFNFFTGLNGIRKFRGSILAPRAELNLKQNTKVFPILGPEPYLYQDYKLRFVTRADFAKIPRYLNDSPIPDNFYRIWVCRSAEALRNFLKRNYYETEKRPEFLTFDIETYFNVPTCLSFCFNGFESICIPLIDQSIDIDNRVIMLQLVSRILTNSDIQKVNQNIKYDIRNLERWNFKISCVAGDTMLAASLIYPEFPKSLAFLNSIYTDIPYFKDEAGGHKDINKIKSKDQYYLYNAKDALATHIIYSQQKQDLCEIGAIELYNNLIELLPIYRQMEDRGLLVSDAVRQQLLIKYLNLYEVECLKLENLTNQKGINPLSPVQMHKIIYDEIGYLPVRGIKRTKKGNPTTNEDALILLKIFGNPKKDRKNGPLIIDSAIACRKLHKVLEILNLPLWPDGRFRCEYNLAGTETGRSTASVSTDYHFYLDHSSTSAKPDYVQLGHSLQTIGKHGFALDGQTLGQDIRNMFQATPGYKFVELDLSGAEARVDACLAGIQDLSYFENPGIHRLTGSWCFNVPPEKIKKGELVLYGSTEIDRYHVAKQVRHAGERNITEHGLVVKLLQGLTVAEGRELLYKFHKFQPEIRSVFHRDVIKAINDTHCLISPNGRRRDFFDRPGQQVYNEGFSQLPQSIVSDQTKFHGVLRTYRETKDFAHLCAESHDGTLWEIPTEKVNEFISIYQKNIESPIDFRNGSLPRDIMLSIPCESAVGGAWGELK